MPYSRDKTSLLSLHTELEQERRRHAATAACLQQEQEMLAILAARLAAVETAATVTTADLSHTQQELQDEQHLYNVALRSLIELRHKNQALQQQVCSLSSNSNPSAGSVRLAGLANRAACIAVAAAAAVTLPIRSPPAVASLAGPAMAAALAARATGAALSTLGRLCSPRGRVPANATPQHAAGQVLPAISIAAAAAAPVSFNCWEQGDVYIQAEDSSCCSSSSSSSSSEVSLGSTCRLLEAAKLGVICAWDDLDSCCSLDCHIDSEASYLGTGTTEDDASPGLEDYSIPEDLQLPPSDAAVPAKAEPVDSAGGCVLTWVLTDRECKVGAAAGCRQCGRMEV
jgi:hypothetical protein